MKCAEHPETVLFLNGECITCYSERKRSERYFNNLLKPFTLAEILKRDVPDKLLNDVTQAPEVAEAERIIYGTQRNP